MNFAAIKTAVTSTAGLKVLAAKKHSPHILFGAGVVGIVGTAVLASRATLKLDGVIKDFENDQARIQKARTDMPEKYAESTAKSDGVIIRAQLVKKICMLYWPAVGLGCVSIAALTGSHMILTRRNTSLVAAYTAVDTAFKKYRGRVVSEYGEDKDRELMFGTQSREVYSEKKNGEPKVETVKSYGDGLSPYAVEFDSTNLNWQQHPSYNAFFLRMVQNHANDQLRSKGHLFLNDVYRELGLDDTEEGAVVGWLWGSKDSDGYVDFGIWEDGNLEKFREFMQGKNGSLMLDFNVDGVIFDQIGKNKHVNRKG